MRKNTFRRTVFHKYSQRCLDIVDHYGVPFHFRLDNGQREHSSYMGALLTFAAIASSMIYCYFKLVTWSQKPDVELTSALQMNVFEQEENNCTYRFI